MTDGGKSGVEKGFLEFARSFPSLTRTLAHDQTFDAARLDAYACSAVSHGQAVTARFVLAVWDPAAEWKSGRFDLMEALRVWDEEHREAFLAWAEDPWWP
jgi:hypothetical protein